MNILNSDGNFSEFSIDRPCHTGDVASKFRKIKVFEVTVCLPILLQLRGWMDTGCVETQWQRWPNAKNMQNWIMKCRLPGKHSVTVRLSDFITICEERSGPDWEGTRQVNTKFSSQSGRTGANFSNHNNPPFMTHQSKKVSKELYHQFSPLFEALAGSVLAAELQWVMVWSLYRLVRSGRTRE